MWELIQNGGIIMGAIIFLSLLAVIIIIERLIYFRKIKTDETALLNRLQSALEKKHYDEALNICETRPSPITNLMKVGIEHRNQPESVIREVIMDAANMEIPELERFLSALGTIAHIAPLLGLLGTVTGNIQTFGLLGGQIQTDSNLLAGGISQALATTAAGIIVSIPATVFYNYLVSKVNHIIIRLQNRVNSLVLLLKSGESQ